ncbi:hypothetical protein AWJ14_06390 [Hoeflea olei]|uniref:Surface antigen domain-containing protein n=1 Tax=Hoeflea olei TaxID=1480615 RepID=A0A1C1YQ18_9HYPH|nr:hypothetical protein AWJ14_06390 [Hoeflea olei]
MSALTIDDSTTGAITPLSADSEIQSDSTVIRDLVGALGQAGMAEPQPWSNTLTGSAGVIGGVTAVADGARACRQFRTTRHSYDGVGMFEGRVCQRPDGGWDLLNFDRIGA